jgi:hypothetical protein
MFVMLLLFLTAMQVYDQIGLLRKRRELLGEAELKVECVPSTAPTYVWLPMCLPGKQRRRAVAALGKVMAQAAALAGFDAGMPGMTASAASAAGPFGEGGPDQAVQVFLRLQISRPPSSGVRLGLTLDLAGIGLCAKSSMYELFNFTVQRLRASMLQTSRDLQVMAAINALQLDNQMLETLRPVVLSPSDISGSGTM